MQHIDDETLALLALGEDVLDDDARAHLASCAECADAAARHAMHQPAHVRGELLGLGPDAPAGVAASEPDDPRQRPVDGLPAEVGMLYDVLSFTRPMSPDEISARSGVTILQTLRGLSTLQGRGLAVRNDAGWKLART